MSVSKLFALYAVSVDSGAAVLVDQIGEQSFANAMNEILLGTGGTVYNQAAAVGSVRQSMRFSTSAIARALAKVTTNGLKICSGHTLVTYLQKLAEGATFDTGANHIKATVNEGIIVPRTLTVRNDGLAVVTFEVVATFDGNNAPIKFEASMSVAGTPVADQMFTVGPLKLNGGTIEGIQSETIDFGLSVATFGGDGEGHVTYAVIRKIQPTIRATSTDASLIQSIGTAGAALTSGTVYLRKIDENGLRVADNVAEHISFTLYDGLYWVSSGPATADGNFTAELLILPTHDGTHEPITGNYAAAIT